MNCALVDVVQTFNEPSLAEQSRRRKLIEELAVAIRQRGTSNVSVSMQSAVGTDRADITEEQHAVQRSVKKLVRAQDKHGFNPPLLAYDPHGRALIAIDPKFRVFLRTESGEIDTLLRNYLLPVDQDREWGWRSRWSDAIKETATTRRWLAQNTGK